MPFAAQESLSACEDVASAKAMKRILIADDEANLRLLVRATLEETGYQIIEADSGPTALESARNELPDLILLDWMFPGLSGIEVALALQENPKTAEIPIVMLTAKGQEADREQGMAAGARAYFTKPFSPLELLDTIEALFTGSDPSPDCRASA